MSEKKIGLCLAKPKDTEQINSFIEQAKLHLKEQGIDQWQSGYPNISSIQEDIEKQRGYLICENETVIGYLCLDFEGDKVYLDIRGQWLSNEPYAVIHRMTIGQIARGKGLGKEVFASAWQICTQRNVHSLRVDTHEMNKKMQHVLLTSGFIYCGKIDQADGERLAFEKIM